MDIKVKIREEKAETKETLISTKLFCAAFRWRLSQNDCQNRGYILDGYPYTYPTAEEVFIVKPDPPKKKEVPEGEEEAPAEEEVNEEEMAEAMKPKF